MHLCNGHHIPTYHIVPGLVDSVDQGVERGKFVLTGSQLLSIFRPVLQDIISLVKGQISATNRDVKAVLLVGGFGQNFYLRKSLREALGGNISVMVPPYG